MKTIVSKLVQATLKSKKGRYRLQQRREEEDRIFKAREKSQKANKKKAISILKEIDPTVQARPDIYD